MANNIIEFKKPNRRKPQYINKESEVLASMILNLPADHCDNLKKLIQIMATAGGDINKETAMMRDANIPKNIITLAVREWRRQYCTGLTLTIIEK